MLYEGDDTQRTERLWTASVAGREGRGASIPFGQVLCGFDFDGGDPRFSIRQSLSLPQEARGIIFKSGVMEFWEG